MEDKLKGKKRLLRWRKITRHLKTASGAQGGKERSLSRDLKLQTHSTVKKSIGKEWTNEIKKWGELKRNKT